MGTLISVDVAQALLSQRVSALAAVNREKRLEREQGERDKSKILGAIERGVDGAAGSGGGSGGLGGPSANGRNRASQAASASPLADLDAQLRAGTLRSGVPEYYTGPKVAATPRGGKGWLLVPSDAEFRVRTRGIRPFSLVQLGNTKIGYLADSGPAGKPALYGTTEVNPDGVGEPITYMPGIYTNSSVDFGKEPRGKSFTLEMMAKLPPYASGSRGPFSTISFSFGAYNLSATRAWSMEQIGLGPMDIPITEVVTPYTRLFFSCGSTDPWFQAYYSNDIEPFPTFDGYSDLQPLRVPGAATPEWQHLAIVQTPGSTEETRNISYYWSGQRLALLSNIDAAREGGWERFTNVSLQMQFGNLIPFYDMPWQDYVVTNSALGHGFRYTPRALYTGDTYTPPVSITALA